MAEAQPPELGPAGGDKSVEVKTKVNVSSDQLEAYNSLPSELQSKLGPPVNGQVMSASALKNLTGDRNSLKPTSTIMCPW